MTTPRAGLQVDTHRPGGAPTSTFAALAIPRYRLLWLGSMFSFLAVQMQIIARGWLAYDLTGSNAGLGGVYLGFGIPMLLFTPWGGVAADRLSKRKVLLASQLMLALGACLIGVALAFDAVEYWMLVVASVLQGGAFSFLGPTRMAFTGELVGPLTLPNAVVLQQMSMNGTRVIGPSLAGMLIGVAFFGIAGVYFLTTGFTLLAAATTFFLPAGSPAADRPQRSIGHELLDGVRYVKHRPPLALLIMTSFVVILAAFPYQAFLPALTKKVGAGSAGYGVISGVSAIGALAASLFIAKRAAGPLAWRLQAVAGVLFGVTVAVLGFAPSFVVVLVIVLGIGAAASAFQALNNSLVMSHTDLAFHGRVQSLMMLSFSGFGMAALPIGALADRIGLGRTLLGMGGVTLAAMAAFLFVRSRIHAREEPEVEGAEWEPIEAELAGG